MRIRLHQLQRTVEKFGGVDRFGLDPLHLFQNAHSVIICFRPEISAADNHIVIDVFVMFRQSSTTLFKLLLGADEIRRDCA